MKTLKLYALILLMSLLGIACESNTEVYEQPTPAGIDDFRKLDALIGEYRDSIAPYNFHGTVDFVFDEIAYGVPDEWVERLPISGTLDADHRWGARIEMPWLDAYGSPLLRLSLSVLETESNLSIGDCKWDSVGQSAAEVVYVDGTFREVIFPNRVGLDHQRIYRWRGTAVLHASDGEVILTTVPSIQGCNFNSETANSLDVSVGFAYCDVIEKAISCSLDGVHVQVEEQEVTFSVENPVLPEHRNWLEQLLEQFGGGELPDIISPGTLYLVELGN